MGRIPTPGSVVGAALGAALAGIAILRRSKPVHTRGAVVPAELEIGGYVPELGAALGQPGRRDVLARFSGGGGLPRGWPDVQGLALRWSGSNGDEDVLLATTGTGPLSRYVLHLHRHPLSGTFTSLMPFRGPRGAVLLSAEPDGARTLLLAWARPRGEWSTFATLRLLDDPDSSEDRPLRFDPVLHAPAGLESYRLWAEVRLPAYRWARAAWPHAARAAPAALRR